MRTHPVSQVVRDDALLGVPPRALQQLQRTGWAMAGSPVHARASWPRWESATSWLTASERATASSQCHSRRPARPLHFTWGADVCRTSASSAAGAFKDWMSACLSGRCSALQPLKVRFGFRRSLEPNDAAGAKRRSSREAEMRRPNDTAVMQTSTFHFFRCGYRALLGKFVHKRDARACLIHGFVENTYTCQPLPY